MTGMTIGFALILFSAICGGVFAVPIKLKRRYELENLYVMAAFITMIALPLLLAPLVLPHWTRAIGEVGPAVIWRGLGFGFAWGMGATTFGYSISLVGLSLGYAVIMGINTAVGSMLPFVVQSRDSLFRPSGHYILVGVAGCVLGVVICSIAGGKRNQKAGNKAPDGNEVVLSSDSRPPGRKFILGLVLCIFSGLMSACANLGFTFTSQVGAAAVRMGASPMIAGLGSWMLVYWGGFTAIFLWFGSQQLRKGTWRNNFGEGSLHDFRLAMVMGVLWFLAMIPYGMGAYYLGRLGTSAGWGISVAASLIVANALGFFTGEWKGAPPAARGMLFAGLSVLIVAMAFLAKGNSLALSEQPAAGLNTAARTHERVPPVGQPEKQMIGDQVDATHI